MKSIGRRGFLKHLIAGASLALVPSLNLSAIEQEPSYTKGSELNKTPTYEEIISTGESSLEERLQAATNFGEENPQAYLTFLENWSDEEGQDKAKFLVEAAMREDVCHMRHLSLYFAKLNDEVATTEHLEQIAQAENRGFFPRLYATEGLGLLVNDDSVDTLLELTGDSDEFIGIEASLALEKALTVTKGKQKKEAQKILYDRLLETENEHLRDHLSWTLRDVYGERELIKQLKKERKEHKPRAEAIIDELKRTYTRRSDGTGYKSEEICEFDGKKKGLHNIYDIWKEKGDTKDLNLKGKKEAGKRFLEFIEPVKQGDKKNWHFMTTYSDYFSFVSDSNPSSSSRSDNASADPRGKYVRLTNKWIEESNTMQVITSSIHEVRHIYSLAIGEHPLQHRGEERSYREPHSSRKIVKEATGHPLYYEPNLEKAWKEKQIKFRTSKIWEY